MSDDKPDASNGDAFMESVAHSELLGRAVSEMRAEVVVRDAWRNALLNNIAQSPPPSAVASVTPIATHRRWSVRPAVALAACLVAMIAGSAATYAVMNRAGSATAPSGFEGTTTAGVSNAGSTTVANSVTNSSQRVMRFVLVAPGAKQVSLVGDFNGWDPHATPLASSNDGTTWLVEMPLSRGRHVYAFVVDGDIIADPSAARVGDQDFGGQNSVIMVGDS